MAWATTHALRRRVGSGRARPNRPWIATGCEYAHLTVRALLDGMERLGPLLRECDRRILPTLLSDASSVAVPGTTKGYNATLPVAECAYVFVEPVSAVNQVGGPVVAAQRKRCC
jgi:hypothetical protein